MFLILIGILIALYLLKRFYMSHTDKLTELGNKIPGPKPLPIIGNALEFGFSTKSIFEGLNWFNKEYGPVARVWIGPELGILLADPLYIELILGTNKNMNKSFLYRFLEPWLGQGVLLSKDDKWKKHRKIVAPTFQGQILAKFVEVFNSNVDTLIEKLSNRQNGLDFDIFPYMNLFALDVICETAMGVKVNAQLHSDSEYVKGVQCLEEIMVMRATAPWLHPDILYRLSPLGRQQKQYLPPVLDMTKHVIHERQKMRSARIEEKHGPKEEDDTGVRKTRAFLDYLMDNTEQGWQLTNQEIQDEVNTILLAGHDTTACSISYTCWLLAKHPHIQEKALAELQTIFGDSVRHCTPPDLTEMKYLEQVIKESLRLLPPVPIFGRKLSEDIKSAKYIFPAGSEVAVNVYMLHRHPDYFPDPEKFDPDRFLPENCVGRHPYCYIPFAGGSRMCLGYKYAIQEMKTAMAHILRHFKILPPQNPFQDLDLTFKIILKSKNGVRVRLEPRNIQPHLFRAV